MPSYELSLTLRILTRPELISSLKRTAETIVDQGGILRQFLSLGSGPLPYKMRAHTRVFKEGTYFLMKFDAPSTALDTLLDELRRDSDLIKSLLQKVEEPAKFECTLDEEMQPPAYRKDVLELVDESKKVIRHRYRQNTPGFSYYPFQR
nr:EOG090X0IQO [Ilyocryptus agilis]